ncbi:MAG: serine/threonine protein kinase, partial [Deltaproteobacteria bacterium]|nr:serine/threonine protein kinase [Deltaproteobacteria bacterium]
MNSPLDMEETWLNRRVNGKYQIIAQLGKGGGGTVFVAQQLSHGDALGEVVLKFLNASLSSDVAACRRFIIEAQAARQVQSPYVMKVFDADTDEHNRPFIVMEYLEGQQLAKWTGGEPLPPSRVFPLAIQLAQALAACHRVGVLHRDLSARNVLVLDDELSATVKIIDFGLALVDHAMTSETISGTPRYMPPEQIRGEPLDAGVDIFALGVLLYECFAGRPPIEATDMRDYLRRNLVELPRPLRAHQPQLPEALDGLLACMMAKERGERPADMRDVLTRLLSVGRANGWIVGAVENPAVAAASTITCAVTKGDVLEA